MNTLPIGPLPSTSSYPFTLKGLRGCTWDQIVDKTCNSTRSGVLDNYSASVTQGYVSRFSKFSKQFQCGTEFSVYPTSVPSHLPTSNETKAIWESMTLFPEYVEYFWHPQRNAFYNTRKCNYQNYKKYGKAHIIHGGLFPSEHMLSVVFVIEHEGNDILKDDVNIYVSLGTAYDPDENSFQWFIGMTDSSKYMQVVSNVPDGDTLYPEAQYVVTVQLPFEDLSDQSGIKFGFTPGTNYNVDLGFTVKKPNRNGVKIHDCIRLSDVVLTTDRVHSLSVSDSSAKKRVTPLLRMNNEESLWNALDTLSWNPNVLNPTNMHLFIHSTRSTFYNCAVCSSEAYKSAKKVRIVSGATFTSTDTLSIVFKISHLKKTIRKENVYIRISLGLIGNPDSSSFQWKTKLFETSECSQTSTEVHSDPIVPGCVWNMAAQLPYHSLTNNDGISFDFPAGTGYYIDLTVEFRKRDQNTIMALDCVMFECLF